MRFQFHKPIVSLVFLLTGSGLVLAQQPSPVQTSPVQTESVARSSPSPEEVLEQLLHRIASTYREMAVISPSDSAAVRELKSRFARLAEDQEKAASAANAMAAYHAQLVALIRQSATATTTTRHPNYADSAFRR